MLTWCTVSPPIQPSAIVGLAEEEVLELENKFNRYDADGSGFIDLEECSCIVDDLNILDDSIAKGHKSKRRAVLKRMIDELDRTMSGTLNFIQFMDLIKRVREGSIEDFLPGCGSPRAASSPRPPSASRRRPQSASPVVTFRPHRTMDDGSPVPGFRFSLAWSECETEMLCM